MSQERLISAKAIKRNMDHLFMTTNDSGSLHSAFTTAGGIHEPFNTSSFGQ